MFFFFFWRRGLREIEKIEIFNKERQSTLCSQLYLNTHMRQESICSLTKVGLCSEHFLSMETLLKGCSPLPSLSFHCVISVTSARLPFCVGLMAGLPGFTSPGSSFHIGVRCQ